jgi:hypothetical protein
MKRRISLALWGTVVLAAVLVAAGPTLNALAGGGGQGARGRVKPPNFGWRGSHTDLSELTSDNWQWLMAVPLETVLAVEETGDFGLVAQQGKVWYLAGGAPYAPNIRTLTVPAGKSLFFLVAGAVAWAPEDGETVEELRGVAGFLTDLVVEMECEVDGVPVEGLFENRVASPGFAFEGGAVFGLEGGRDLAAGDGYWLMLDPLSPGEHVIEYHSVHVFPDGFVLEFHNVYLLTVTE